MLRQNLENDIVQPATNATLGIEQHGTLEIDQATGVWVWKALGLGVSIRALTLTNQACTILELQVSFS